MSKKNKIVYSDIQPNTKEAGVWVNTVDGNVKVEKDGNWVDDSGSGSGSSDKHVIYYKCDDGVVHINDFMNVYSFISFLRSEGPSTRDDCKMYHPIIIADMSHGSLSQSVYVEAFAFLPIKSYISGGGGWFEYSSYEELREAYPELPAATRITEEEYWADYDA